MNLLPEASAPIDEQVLALRERCGVRVLRELSVLEVTGGDRAAWLNGLVTQDTRALPAGSAAYAAAVAVKGKVLTDLWVLARANSLLLLVPSTRVADLTAHLDRYIVMEDVALAPLDALVVSMQGPTSVAPRLPDVFPVDRLGRGGVDLVVPAGMVADLTPSLEAWIAGANGCVVSDEAWERARVQAAVPRFGVDFDTANFVQEAAITRRAVSFNKGCYLGQEVVCRLEMRGHVQKHLLALHVDGVVPRRGEQVRADGQDVGEVTSVAESGTGADVIAMVRYAAVDRPLELCGVAAVSRRAAGE